MNDSGSKHLKSCLRLVDYVCVVGAEHSSLDSSKEDETGGGNLSAFIKYPVLLKRYPLEDHKDFPLPVNIVNFCQPEGCIIIGPKKTAVKQSNYFVFTLTDKDSGITRYGVCLNFYRPIPKYDDKRKKNDSPSSQRRERQGSGEERSSDSAFSSDYRSSAHVALSDSDKESRRKPPSRRHHSQHHHHRRQRKKRKSEEDDKENEEEILFSIDGLSPHSSNPKKKKRRREKTGKSYGLTSLCLVSHYPFFTNFRECLNSLKRLIDACEEYELTNYSPRRRGSSKKKSKIHKTATIWSLMQGKDTVEEGGSISILAHRDARDIEQWISRLLASPVPAKNNRIQLDILPEKILGDSLPLKSTLTFALPDHTRFPLCDFPIHLPIELLGVTTCLQVLILIMLEKKVVFQSMEYSALSISILAFTKLLYPIEYMFPVIPLLPPSMNGSEQLLLAPTPYIIGIPSNFFSHKKNVQHFLDDVWVVDLDVNQITPPCDTSLSDLPAFPEPEGRILKTDLKQALASLSFQPIKNFDDLPPESLQKLAERQQTPESFTPVSGHNPFIFGNDSDSVDIATRIAMVNFFNSKNILASFGEHTRTLRLYPRPIVSFQIQSFIRSRDKGSAFINQFSSTQSVEFFGEWSLRPTNVAFLRIHSGIYDPTLVGDKSKWFAHTLEPEKYGVWDEQSGLNAVLKEITNNPEEPATDESGSDSEEEFSQSASSSTTSSSSSSLSDFMSSDMTTPAGSAEQSKNKSSTNAYALTPDSKTQDNELVSSYSTTPIGDLPSCRTVSDDDNLNNNSTDTGSTNNRNNNIIDEQTLTSEESEENSASIATTKTMRCLKQPGSSIPNAKSSSPSFGSDVSIAGSLCSDTTGNLNTLNSGGFPSTPARSVPKNVECSYMTRQNSIGSLNNLSNSPLNSEKKRSSISSGSLLDSLSNVVRSDSSGSFIFNDIGKFKLSRSRRNSRTQDTLNPGNTPTETRQSKTSEDVAQELFYNIEQFTMQAKKAADNAAESLEMARNKTIKASKNAAIAAGVKKDTLEDIQHVSKNVVDDISKTARTKKKELLRAFGDSSVEGSENQGAQDCNSASSSRRSSKDFIRSLSRDIIGGYNRSNSGASSPGSGSTSGKSTPWKFSAPQNVNSNNTTNTKLPQRNLSPSKPEQVKVPPPVPPRSRPPPKAYQESFVRPETENERRRSIKSKFKDRNLPPPDYPPPPLPVKFVEEVDGKNERRRSRSPLRLKTQFLENTLVITTEDPSKTSSVSPKKETINQVKSPKQFGNVPSEKEETDNPLLKQENKKHNPSNASERKPSKKDDDNEDCPKSIECSTPKKEPKKPENKESETPKKNDEAPKKRELLEPLSPHPTVKTTVTPPPPLKRSSSNLSNTSHDILFSIGSDFSGLASQTSSLIGDFFSSRSSTPTFSARSISPAPRPNSGFGFTRSRSSVIRHPRGGEESWRYDPERKAVSTIAPENNSFIKDILDKILQGEGISWLKLNRLRKLMEQEVNRSFALSSLNKMVDKRSLGSDEHVGDVMMKENVWNGILKLSLAIAHGLEASLNNCGIGGMASAYHMLEIAHTHFWSKELTTEIDNRSQGRSLISTPSSPFGSRDNLSLRSASPRNSLTMSINSKQSAESNATASEDSQSLKKPAHDAVTSPGSGGTSADSENEVTKALLNQKKTLLMNRMASVESNFSAIEDPLESDSQSLVCSETGSFITNPSFSLQRSLPNRFGIHSSMRSVMSDSELEHSNFSFDKRIQNNVVWPNKSSVSAGYRFHGGTIQASVQTNNTLDSERKYIFQGLLDSYSSRKDNGSVIWENLQLWENIFLDIVVQERNLIGMDSETSVMMERYKNLSSIERKRLEHEEDRLLSTLLYNVTAFMVMMQMDKGVIRKKIRRLLGKSHIGLSYSQEINQLLDDINNLAGNDIDLKPLPSRQLNRQCFTVHAGTNAESDLLFMEVRHDGLILRTINGSVLERWFFDKLVNMTFSPKTKVICLWRRVGGHTQLHKYYTKKCKDLYYCIKEAMENAASRGSALSGHELGGEFPVEDLNTGEGGLLQVCMEGVGLLFANSKFFIRMDHIRKCFTQKGGIFVLEEFNPKTRQIIQRRYSSAMAHDICYSVLCVFSYVAAGQKQNSMKKKRQNSVKS